MRISEVGMPYLEKLTSRFCHQSVIDASCMEEGDEMYAAARSSISQVPMEAAISAIRFSSVISATQMELGQDSNFCVSSKVDCVRPSSIILLAPARENDAAVARPMPLPCNQWVSV